MNARSGSTVGSAFLRGAPRVLPSRLVLGLLSACVAPDDPDSAPDRPDARTPADAGRYLVQVGGCNDCHTPGFAETGGNVDEAAWLTGSPLGYRGPWGTSYAANLRRTVDGLTEEAWIAMARTRNALPPMPWASLHAMSDEDLRSIYAYLRDLGPEGEAAPAALPPGVEPTGPWMDFSVHGVPGMVPADR